MRRILPACGTALSVAAAVVLLSACGGSDEDNSAAGSSEATSSASESGAPAAGSQFCTEAAGIQEKVGASFDEQDPAGLGAALKEGAAEIRGIEPPAEIAADWNALADGLDQIAVAFAEVDLTDPAAQQVLGQKIAELQGPLDTASTNVETYLREECGLELDPGESAAPSS